MIALLSLSAVVVAAGLLAAGIRRHGRAETLLSPVALLVLLLVGHAAMRPLVLDSDPSAAVLGVFSFGWDQAALAEASGLLIAGFGLLGAGFVAAPRGTPSAAGSNAIGARRCLVAAAVGSVLWGLLFLRLGGPRAFIDNPASFKTGQFGGAYGLLGLSLCLGATLFAWDAWLRRPDRRALAVVAICAATALAGSLLLATRGPLGVTVLAALFLLGRRRRISPRVAVATGLVLAVAFAGLQSLRQVREYAQSGSVTEAVATTLETDPLSLVSADLIEYDHLVALTQLVPEPLPRLHGESLSAVPGVFVPRALWPGKPRPVDYRLSVVLYGPQTTAGTPFTLPGELWWNFGWLGVLIACPLAGYGLGALWWRFSARSGTGQVLVAVLGGYAYLLLTRPLAAMVLTATIGAAGVLLIGPWPAALLRSARTLFGLRGRLGLRPPSDRLEAG